MTPSQRNFLRKAVAGGLAAGLVFHVALLLTAPAAIGGGRLGTRSVASADPVDPLPAGAPVVTAVARPVVVVPEPESVPPPVVAWVEPPPPPVVDDPFARLAQIDRQLDMAMRAAIEAGLARRDVRAFAREWDYALRFAEQDPGGVARALERMAEDLSAFAADRPV